MTTPRSGCNSGRIRSADEVVEHPAGEPPTGTSREGLGVKSTQNSDGPEWSWKLANCPEGPHRGPQGPNEDLSQCPTCYFPSWAMRPANEQMGLHADDCSLDRRHGSYCVGGGNGHPPTEVVRGYWPGMDDDIAAARARFREVS